MSQSSLIIIVLITGHFSNYAVMLKFRGKGQIPRLGSKFHGPRKTVGPNDVVLISISNVLSQMIHTS